MGITDMVLVLLGEVLSSNDTSEELNLGGCEGVTSDGWVSLSAFLRHNKRLKKLDLIYNNTINDIVLVAFERYLKLNSTLEVLRIGHDPKSARMLLTRLLSHLPIVVSKKFMSIAPTSMTMS